MGQCNAQSSSALSGMVSDQSTAPSSKIYTTTKEEPPSKLRGLDLIKSCAKYYENGAPNSTVISSVCVYFWAGSKPGQTDP